MAVHGDNFECLLDDDGLKQFDFSSQIPRRSKRHGRTLGFKDSSLNNLVDSEMEWIELDNTCMLNLTWNSNHSIVVVSGCNTKTETMRTPWRRLQDKPVLDGRHSLILNKIDEARSRSVRLKRSFLLKHVASCPASGRALWIRICPNDVCSTRFGGTDWEPHF